MHSPPRPVSVKDQQDWKIPPCISNWKNAKGYTIPLDKRLAADGRGLQETAINDNFAQFTEALYVAEQTARQAGAVLGLLCGRALHVLLCGTVLVQQEQKCCVTAGQADGVAGLAVECITAAMPPWCQELECCAEQCCAGARICSI